jgi:hypothetical protein
LYKPQITQMNTDRLNSLDFNLLKSVKSAGHIFGIMNFKQLL